MGRGREIAEGGKGYAKGGSWARLAYLSRSPRVPSYATGSVVFLCVSVGHTGEPYKNDRTDRGAVWSMRVDSSGPDLISVKGGNLGASSGPHRPL